MTTILYFFWDGFSEQAVDTSITGQWANVIDLYTSSACIDLYPTNRCLELHTSNQELDL